MDVTALWEELASSLVPLLRDYRSRLRELDVASKLDNTLLSEADIAIQEHIVARIFDVDPSAGVLAEEESPSLWSTAPGESQNGRLWLVDPIDGTSEFLNRDRFEFCSVVCLLEELRPTAALIVAPEIGVGHGSVCVHVAGDGAPPVVNGSEVRRPAATGTRRTASITRSVTTPRRPFEQRLAAQGFELKTRTTSQTLDMVRTCVDLAMHTEQRLPPFSLFYREAQKVWDGAAGICLAHATGLRVTDRHGHSLVPVDNAILHADEPCFDSTLVAAAAVAGRFLALLNDK